MLFRSRSGPSAAAAPRGPDWPALDGGRTTGSLGTAICGNEMLSAVRRPGCRARLRSCTSLSATGPRRCAPTHQAARQIGKPTGPARQDKHQRGVEAGRPADDRRPGRRPKTRSRVGGSCSTCEHEPVHVTATRWVVEAASSKVTVGAPGRDGSLVVIGGGGGCRRTSSRVGARTARGQTALVPADPMCSRRSRLQELSDPAHTVWSWPSRC